MVKQQLYSFFLFVSFGYLFRLTILYARNTGNKALLVNSPSIPAYICIFRWHQDISAILIVHSSSSNSTSSISGDYCKDKVLWQEEEVLIPNDCNNILYTFI